MAAVSFPVNKQLSFKSAILISLLLLVGAFVLKTHITSRHAKSVSSSMALVDCYKAEMLMRLANVVEILRQSKFHTQSNKNASDTNEVAKTQATELLDKAIAEEPDHIVIRCKKIILEAELGKSAEPDLDKLVSICARPNKKKISVEEEKLANLTILLYALHPARYVSPELFELQKEADNILTSTLSDGWYKEMALLKIYKVEKLNDKYNNLLSESQNKNWRCFFKLIMVGMAVIIAAIVGVIIILYQVLITNKQTIIHSEKIGDSPVKVEQGRSKYNWQTVTLVFLAWFFTQVFVAYIANVFKQKGLFISYANALSTAISIVLIYLLSNGTVLLYIYFLAFRPNGLKLSDGLNLRLRVSNHGTIALAIIGLFGWFAAMPIVLAASLVSAFCFGSGGSNNPIISIIMAAAQANDFTATLLFYFVTGILAPICEESLFRGFLYGYLRGRHGVLFSNIFSSALFSIAHFDPGAMLPLFCLGSVFAYLTEKTGSIVPSMIAHGLWNSATFTLVLLLFGS